MTKNEGFYGYTNEIFVLEEAKMWMAQNEIRPGMGAYAGAASRRVHLASFGLRLTHRLDRRQARHAYIH